MTRSSEASSHSATTLSEVFVTSSSSHPKYCVESEVSGIHDAFVDPLLREIIVELPNERDFWAENGVLYQER